MFCLLVVELSLLTVDKHLDTCTSAEEGSTVSIKLLSSVHLRNAMTAVQLIDQYNPFKA